MNQGNHGYLSVKDYGVLVTSFQSGVLKKNSCDWFFSNMILICQQFSYGANLLW